MKKLFPVLAALALVTSSGCAPPVDVEAERAAIRRFHDECINAALAGDVGVTVSCFAEEGQLLPPNASLIKGKDAIGEFLSQIVENPSFSGSHKIAKVEVSRSGDLAYIHYTYELTLNDPDGNPVTEHGKAIYVLKKTATGEWKFLIDIWNADPPAIGAGA